jgi:hypothetical protein
MKRLFLLRNRIKDSIKFRRLLFLDYIRHREKKIKLVVTIFGSCRQDSISKNFIVTSIRDSLTYPHYSKEAIQAIKYCKSRGENTPSSLKVFRNNLLNIRMNSPDKLRKEFERTDIFVVEIASMLEYKKGDLFYHHIAGDLVDGIEIRKQEFEELREDILHIASLLSPKPVLFCTHYSTQNSGKRLELINYIEQVCKSHNMEFFNPSDANKVWESRILHEDEVVISHFSKAGHEIMAGRYREKLLSLNVNFASFPLVQKYKPGIVLNDYHGLGDFIFGSLRMHQEAISRKRAAFIDVSEHPLSQFFTSTFVAGEKTITPIVQESYSNLFGKASTIFTHLRPLRQIALSDVDFVLRNVFDPTDEFLEQIRKYQHSYDAQRQNYSIVHFRLGDEYMPKSVENAKILDSKQFDQINEFVSRHSKDKRIIVASDSLELLNELDKMGHATLSGKVAHLGKEGQDPNAIRDTLLQFMIFKDASEIIQVSNYGWGSGFSETAAILGQAPLVKVSFQSIEKKE